jgi:hypothetical protein
MSTISAYYPGPPPIARMPMAPPLYLPTAPTLAPPLPPMAPPGPPAVGGSYASATGYYVPQSANQPMPSQMGGPMRPNAYGGGVNMPAMPGGRMIAEFGGGGWVDMGGNLAHIYNMAKTGITGGKGVNSAFGELWRAVKGLHGNGLFAGLKGIVAGTIPYATNSALFEGAISAIVNGYKLFTRQESVGAFGGNVVGDTMAGLAGGAGAAFAGGIAMAILPFSGTLGLIITGLAGIFGFGFASNMMRSTGIYGTITGGIRNALGG